MAAKKRRKKTYYAKSKSARGPGASRTVAVYAGVFLFLAALFGVYHLMVFAGSLFFSRNPTFTMQNLIMQSDGRLTPDMLAKYADVHEGMNLFEADFDALRSRLESVSLVESVQLRRQLPDTLVVDVVERVAVAQIYWKRGAMPYLIDRHGVVFPLTKSGRSLPMIEGYQVEQMVPGDSIKDPGVQYVLELISVGDMIVEPGFQVTFERFDLRNPDYVTATLEGGVTARFPRHSANIKLIRLARIMKDAREQGKRVRTADLTPDGVNVPVTFY